MNAGLYRCIRRDYFAEIKNAFIFFVAIGTLFFGQLLLADEKVEPATRSGEIDVHRCAIQLPALSPIQRTAELAKAGRLLRDRVIERYFSPGNVFGGRAFDWAIGDKFCDQEPGWLGSSKPVYRMDRIKRTPHEAAEAVYQRMVEMFNREFEEEVHGDSAMAARKFRELEFRLKKTGIKEEEFDTVFEHLAEIRRDPVLEKTVKDTLTEILPLYAPAAMRRYYAAKQFKTTLDEIKRPSYLTGLGGATGAMAVGGIAGAFFQGPAALGLVAVPAVLAALKRTGAISSALGARAMAWAHEKEYRSATGKKGRLNLDKMAAIGGMGDGLAPKALSLATRYSPYQTRAEELSAINPTVVGFSEGSILAFGTEHQERFGEYVEDLLARMDAANDPSYWQEVEGRLDRTLKAHKQQGSLRSSEAAGLLPAAFNRRIKAFLPYLDDFAQLKADGDALKGSIHVAAVDGAGLVESLTGEVEKIGSTTPEAAELQEKAFLLMDRVSYLEAMKGSIELHMLQLEQARINTRVTIALLENIGKKVLQGTGTSENLMVPEATIEDMKTLKGIIERAKVRR